MTPSRRETAVVQAPLRARRVLVLLLPDVHLQDMSGPVQVLDEASHLGGAYQLSYCGATGAVRSAQGLLLSDLLQLPAPREGDLVLVPGTSSAKLDHLAVPGDWLRAASAARARVAREMVVYLRRNGQEKQRSVYLDHRTHLHPGVHRVQVWLVANPQKKPLLSQLARIAAMSPRHLARVFRRATGVTPKQFAAKVKVQVARDLLGDPQRTVEAIAASCGFDDARQLRRLWKQSFGVSIAAFRAAHSNEGSAP